MAEEYSTGLYVPKRGGSLEKYLETHDGHSVFPLFRGPKMFEILMKKGYFLPDYSVVRLMWNVGRGDEHFYVDKDYKLVGVDVPVHAGRHGVHSYKDILKDDGPSWEASSLATTPYLKEEARKALLEYKKRKKKK